MNSVVHYNPQSQSFAGKNLDGTWANKPVKGISSPVPEKQNITVLTQHPAPANKTVKIL